MFAEQVVIEVPDWSEFFRTLPAWVYVVAGALVWYPLAGITLRWFMRCDRGDDRVRHSYDGDEIPPGLVRFFAWILTPVWVPFVLAFLLVYLVSAVLSAGFVTDSGRPVQNTADNR